MNVHVKPYSYIGKNGMKKTCLRVWYSEEQVLIIHLVIYACISPVFDCSLGHQVLNFSADRRTQTYVQERGCDQPACVDIHVKI